MGLAGRTPTTEYIPSQKGPGTLAIRESGPELHPAGIIREIGELSLEVRESMVGPLEEDLQHIYNCCAEVTNTHRTALLQQEPTLYIVGSFALTCLPNSDGKAGYCPETTDQNTWNRDIDIVVPNLGFNEFQEVKDRLEEHGFDCKLTAGRTNPDRPVFKAVPPSGYRYDMTGCSEAMLSVSIEELITGTVALRYTPDRVLWVTPYVEALDILADRPVLPFSEQNFREEHLITREWIFQILRYFRDAACTQHYTTDTHRLRRLRAAIESVELRYLSPEKVETLSRNVEQKLREAFDHVAENGNPAVFFQGLNYVRFFQRLFPISWAVAHMGGPTSIHQYMNSHGYSLDTLQAALQEHTQHEKFLRRVGKFEETNLALPKGWQLSVAENSRLLRWSLGDVVSFRLGEKDLSIKFGQLLDVATGQFNPSEESAVEETKIVQILGDYLRKILDTYYRARARYAIRQEQPRDQRAELVDSLTYQLLHLDIAIGDATRLFTRLQPCYPLEIEPLLNRVHLFFGQSEKISAIAEYSLFDTIVDCCQTRDIAPDLFFKWRMHKTWERVFIKDMCRRLGLSLTSSL